MALGRLIGPGASPWVDLSLGVQVPRGLPPLPPRIRGVLRHGGLRLEVEGCPPGCNLVIVANGAQRTFLPTGWRFVCAVPGSGVLVAGTEVTAQLRPTLGPPSEVTRAVVSPLGATALLPKPVVEAPSVAHAAVRVTDVPPGYLVDLDDAAGLVGSAYAGADSVALIPVDGPIPLTGAVVASVVGTALASASVPVDPEAPALAAPALPAEIYPGQSALRLANLVAGLRVSVSFDDAEEGTSELVFDDIAAANAFTAWCTRGPTATETVSAWQSRDRPTVATGPVATATLTPLAALETPSFAGPVYAGATSVHVQHVPAGMSVSLTLKNGHVVARHRVVALGEDHTLELGEPLYVGDVLTLLRVADGAVSAATPVLPTPASAQAPWIPPRQFVGGRSLLLGQVAPGSRIEVVRDDGVVLGRVASYTQHAIVPLWPPLRADLPVTATAWFDDDDPRAATASANEVYPEAAADPLPKPRVLSPLSVGDDQVWVSGVVPGARVILRQRTTIVLGLLPGHQTLLTTTRVIATAELAEPWTDVPVDIPVAPGGEVQAEVILDGRSTKSEWTAATRGPELDGLDANGEVQATAWRDVTFTLADGTSTSARVFFPSDRIGRCVLAANAPIVLIQHGDAPGALPHPTATSATAISPDPSRAGASRSSARLGTVAWTAASLWHDCPPSPRARSRRRWGCPWMPSPRRRSASWASRTAEPRSWSRRPPSPDHSWTPNAWKRSRLSGRTSATRCTRRRGRSARHGGGVRRSESRATMALRDVSDLTELIPKSHRGERRDWEREALPVASSAFEHPGEVRLDVHATLLGRSDDAQQRGPTVRTLHASSEQAGETQLGVALKLALGRVVVEGELRNCSAASGSG